LDSMGNTFAEFVVIYRGLSIDYYLGIPYFI
jgi:hypothetical protein